MRFTSIFMTAFGLILGISAPTHSHDTSVDEAMHCAALARITVDILGSAGELTAEDREAMDQAVELMLTHSKEPAAKAKRALKAHIKDIRAHHSDAEIAEEIDQKSDHCVEKYVN